MHLPSPECTDLINRYFCRYLEEEEEERQYQEYLERERREQEQRRQSPAKVTLDHSMTFDIVSTETI